MARDGVDVDGEHYQATRALVIATGTTAVVLPIPGLAGSPYWTHREAIEAEELPRSIVVLGGGAIGAELAQVYARFGVDVTIVEALPRLLPLEEPEAGDLLADVFHGEGIDVVTGAGATQVDYDGKFRVRSMAVGTWLLSGCSWRLAAVPISPRWAPVFSAWMSPRRGRCPSMTICA